VLDRPAHAPVATREAGIQLLVGEPKQGRDELRTRQVGVHQERAQVRVPPPLQQAELVADAPDLAGVLLLMKDVVHQQVTRRAAASARAAARLLQVLLRESYSASSVSLKAC
jgi:hypothetical protein